MNSNAMEDVKFACTIAGLPLRNAHTRNCGMHLGKRIAEVSSIIHKMKYSHLFYKKKKKSFH